MAAARRAADLCDAMQQQAALQRSTLADLLRQSATTRERIQGLCSMQNTLRAKTRRKRSGAWQRFTGKSGCAHQQHGAQLRVGARAVFGRVVAEDGGAVEGAVILWVVQPALGVVRAVPPHPEADDVRGAAHKRDKHQGIKARQVHSSRQEG